jgi:hypothetical protein
VKTLIDGGVPVLAASKLVGHSDRPQRSGITT